MQQLFKFRHRVHRCGNRLAEGCTIILGDESRIGDDDDASIGLRAHQPSEALPELDDSLWKRIVAKRTAPFSVNLLRPRLDDGISHLRERQPRQHDARKRFARHVYTFPEGLGAEEDGLRFEA